MLKKIINTGLLVCTLLVYSCSQEETKAVEIPANIINKERFATLLRDFALAESAANSNIKNIRLSSVDSAYAFDPLKDNRVTQAQYDSALVFYSNHPKLYKEVYDMVLQKLSEMEAKRNSVKKDSASR